MQRHRFRLIRGVRFIPALVGICLGLFAPTPAHAEDPAIVVPSLNPELSPLASENRTALYDRLVATFQIECIVRDWTDTDEGPCDGPAAYYRRREIQAFVDMWRATGTQPYLDQARDLALSAIKDAAAHPRPLLWHGQSRGEWPCFYLETIQAETGGHNQLCDFQGSVGFLIAARCLYEANDPAWLEIADFVERDIVEKWLYYRPTVTPEDFTGSASSANLLAALNSGRDVREQFACICLDLHQLGYRTYPYRKWAALLIDLYLTPRWDPNQRAPHAERIPNHIPDDWGLLPGVIEDGRFWLAVPNYDPNRTAVVMDTSHANRTAWLAARACDEGLLDDSVAAGLASTLRFQIWAPEKGPFYFNNYLDGSDGNLDDLEAGRAGNIWFGWHRLAAYDEILEELFLLIAYDLTTGGLNLPYAAQNQRMKNAPLCLEAWGTRLLAGERARPSTFP